MLETICFCFCHCNNSTRLAPTQETRTLNSHITKYTTISKCIIKHTQLYDQYMVLSYILYIKIHCANTIRDHWNKWFHWISHSSCTILPLASANARRSNGIVGSRRSNGLLLQFLFQWPSAICAMMHDMYDLRNVLLSSLIEEKPIRAHRQLNVFAPIDMRCIVHALCICCIYAITNSL